MDFYSKAVFDHYKHPRNWGKIKKPTHTATVVNKSCGDAIRVELVVKKNIVTDIKFRSTGCAVSTAAMSILSEKIRGRQSADIEKLTEEDMRTFFPIRISPGRTKCLMLGVLAVKQVLEKGFLSP